MNLYEHTPGARDSDTYVSALVLSGLEVESGDKEIGGKLSHGALEHFVGKYGAEHPRAQAAKYETEKEERKKKYETK